MDTELQNRINALEGGTEQAEREMKVNFETGELEIGLGDTVEHYLLKPLRELYGQGYGIDTVDPQNEIFMPLFLAIEENIARFYTQEKPGFTDAAVSLMLDQLGNEPNSPGNDPLARRVNSALRLCLSLNDYSRFEVRAALRKVRKSVERHTRLAGPTGYLDFIAGFYGR
jgi:hypothetical protein